MLTAKFELEQEDVNPDDNLEPKQHSVESHSQQLSPRVLLVLKSARHHPEGYQQIFDNRKLLHPLPLSAANQQQQQQFPQIKLKRRYRDKENSGCGEREPEPISLEQEEEEEPIRKRSLLELVEEDIRRRLEESASTQKARKKKHYLSLAGEEKSKGKNNLAVKEFIQSSPPVFEEEEKESEVAKNIERTVSQETFSGRSKRLSQQIDWDQVEVCTEDEKEEVKERISSPFDFDSLFADKVDRCAPRTYAGCSSSRLSLSKNFQQQQQQQLLNDPQASSVAATVANQISGGDKRKLTACGQEQQQPKTEAKCAKLLVGGEDDMSIHHQQHYHLPCTSVSTTTTSYHPEVATTSSILLLAAAAGESGKMSGHSHYTRSKNNAFQGRVSLTAAADMAISSSLGELPRSKVSSLQGRVDTGTATELAIAQSLSEDQQNMLNSGVSAASPVVISLCTSTTPASIAAAANMNNSLATLCNIGNSCYLNSVLYTLRFAPNFIHNLHHLIEDTDSVYQRLSQNKLKSSSLGRNIPGLHGTSGRSWSSKDLASLGGSTTTNNSSASTLSGPTSATNGTSGPTSMREENLPPKTNRQVVTEQLHELFQNLHRNEAIEAMEPFHAGNILRAVQDVSATFEGNQQQDAHEFLMCVLDSIRESCQALIKTITDHPDVLINTCPPVPECIETFVPESKSSGTRHFFRRRKESVKTPKPATNNGGATLPKVSGGGDGATSDQLANFKNALFAKPSSALDEQLVRDRVQALGLDFFRDDFEGVTVSKTKCLACETCTEQKETMIDIAIPIAASEVSDASKNPQLFYQNSCITREYFRGDNKYRCEVCCGYREAIRSISFEILPRQLILQLKRFNGDMEKINSYIPTPFVLRCFCNTCLPKPDCDKPHIYRLYSVITHVGARMSVGHYIAYTSSLDVHAEYLGCGKDRRRQLLLAGGSLDGGGSGSLGGIGGGSTGSTGKSGSEKSTSGQLKKLFSSKKASSAGDMSKKIKSNVVNKLNLINGMEGLNLINGTSAANTLVSSNTVSFGSQSGSNSPSSNGTPTSSGGSLASRIPCAGLNCCGIHLKNSHLSFYGSSSGSSNNSNTVGTNADSGLTTTNGIGLDGSATTDSHVNCINSSTSPAMAINGLAPTATTAAAFEQSLSQQLWHMCDDDKIKIMSQVEFEELLSPNRRHVITPYLLFYARYDLIQGSRSKESADSSSVATKTSDSGVDGIMID